MLHAQALARGLEAVSREAGAAVREHMGDLEGKGLDGFFQKGHGTALSLVVLDGEVDEPRGAVDSHIQVPLAALTVAGAQLGQVLHVHMDKAEIVVLEAAVRSAGGGSWRGGSDQLAGGGPGPRLSGCDRPRRD